MPGDSLSKPVVPSKNARAILVIAHPGHELRVHKWLETTCPDVWVLTDGSGRSNQSRIKSTTRVLEAAGAHPGSVYGNLTDVDLYELVLNFDHHEFTSLVDRLANTVINNHIDLVAGDAEEGYNPAHDICRLIVNAAVKLAKNSSAARIKNFAFTLMGPPDRRPDRSTSNALTLTLDPVELDRKLSAARSYPELQAEVVASLSGADHEAFNNDPDLAQRVRSLFGTTNLNDFRVECLSPVELHNGTLNRDVPFYEIYGERQVKAGHYKQVLRYREHVLPLALALAAHVERNS